VTLVPCSTTPVHSSILAAPDASQDARRSRFMKLVEALRREPEFRVSDRLLQLLHEYGVRPDPVLARVPPG
jgi:hypothetical protein